MDMIEIPADFFNFAPVEAPCPRVYYDPADGMIRGISFTADETLATYPHIFIEEAQALRLMDGSEPLDKWVVDYVWTDSPKLVSLENHTVEIDLQGTGRVELLKSDAHRVASVTLKVTVSRHGDFIGFQFHSLSRHWTIDLKEDRLLRFFVTRKGNPQAIIGLCEISAKDLTSHELITARLSREVGQNYEIYTERFEPLNYVVEEVDRVRPILDLPTLSFEDVRLLPPAPAELPPALLAERRDDGVHFWLHNGGGAIYNRKLTSFMVALVAPGDPHHPLAISRISVEELEDRGVTLPLPPNLVTREFDICTQMLYHTAFHVQPSDHRV